MRKLIVIILILLIVGCSQVQMSAGYREQLESSAIVVAELNRRAQAGDVEAAKRGLNVASETLNLLVAGLHGTEIEEPNNVAN